MPDETRPADEPPRGNTSDSPDRTATVAGALARAREAPAPAGATRYVLGAEIARGGMGAVHEARDTVLGRTVAVKVLRDKFGPTSGAALRFADEARITAQLQHPAIPPVHDLGALPDERPFLAMKLIKGDTLERHLADRPSFQAGPPPTGSPELPPVAHDRGRFVAVFEQISQAIAYAHAHNVIHRDLKPANVMVGQYGEVQVMDWGLAKVLNPAAPAPDADPDQTSGGTEIRSLRDTGGSETQAGSVLGTPAFMPPEQALGALHKVDARSDVFGLGAILAVILTGQPPFTGRSAEDVRIKAAQGKLGECFARLDATDADPGLVALAKRCLAAEPEDRPADAGAVARAVADLRAAAEERAKRAEVERARTEVQAAEQRRRRRALTLAGAALLAVLGAGVAGTGAGLVQAQEQRRGAEAARDEARSERDNARKARDDADEQRREAERTRDALAAALRSEQAARKEADESYQLAREAVVGVAWDIPDVLREAMYAQSAQRKVVSVLADTMEKQLALASTRNLPDRALHRTVLKMGDLRYVQSKWDEAQKLYGDALALSARLLKTEERERDRAKVTHASSHRALGFLAREGRNNMALALDQFRSAERLQREVLDAPTTGEITPAEAKLYLSGSLYEIADVHARQQQFDTALKVCNEALALRRAALALPQTANTKGAAAALAESCVQLGEIQFARGESAAAEAAMREAVARHAAELARDPGNLFQQRQTAKANRALGDLLLFLKRYDDAGPAHAADAELSLKLLRIPEIMSAQTDLSRAQYRSATLALKRGDRAAARDLYARCAAVRREVIAAQPDNDFAKIGLAAALARSGDHVAALEVLAPLRRRFPFNISVVSESAAVLGMCADAARAGRAPDELPLLDRWLERAYRDAALESLRYLVTGWIYLDLVKLETDPDLDPIRADPRFAECVQIVRDRIAQQKMP